MLNYRFAKLTSCLTLFLFSGVTVAACTVSALPVAFGEYSPFATTDLDSAGSVTVNCDARTTFVISLSTGQSGSYASRYMTSGVNQLSYNLYTNNGRSIIWGDGTGGSTTVSHNSKAKTDNIYGEIPKLQTNIATGVYSDTITLTVDY